MKNKMMTGLVVGCVLVAGCHSPSYLERQYKPARADFTDQALPGGDEPAASEPAMSNPDPSGNTLPGVLEPTVRGTWTFTTPSTVTRVNRTNDDLSQSSLYMGRPPATEKPFVVITVSSDVRSLSETEPETYKVTGSRQYVLNENIAQEWTGRTKDGSAFCELILSRPGGSGDRCHAMAVAKNGEERKLSLEILANITWTAKGSE